MALKPQDLLVVLKLWSGRDQDWTYPTLAEDLGMSMSEVHGAIRRAALSGLLPEAKANARPLSGALQEFLVHGVKYAFPPERGELTRGIPTAHAAPPLEGLLAATTDPPPVWPHPKGKVRGTTFVPLYPAAPGAALADPGLYELLALVDAIRGGRARERNLAEKELEARLR